MDKLKEKAVREMMELDLPDYHIVKFVERDLVYCHQNGRVILMPTGLMNQQICELEQRYGILIYAVVAMTNPPDFKMCSFLYVDGEDDTDMESDGEGIPVKTYTTNAEYPMFSEFGWIGVVNKDGVLKRVW